MRTFAEKRNGGAGTESPAVHRGPTPVARMQRAVGNLAMQERFAHQAESRARATPAPDGLLVGGSLSDTGRRYFESIVGGDVASARAHVGGRANAIAELAHAEAMSVGNEVFLPKGAESDRGLLAHELAHVVHAPAGTPPLA